MAQAYTPGLTVAGDVVLRGRRVLPVAGEVLVTVGQSVAARDVVAQTFMPGDITPLNMANLLSVSAGDVAAAMLKKQGEHVSAGEVLARTSGIFGFFKAETTAPVSGTIELISRETGQVMIRGEPIPVQVRAFLTGRVVEVLPQSGAVVEARVSHVQGIFGIGGEAFGPIRVAGKSADQPLTPELISEEMRGAIVIGGGRVTAAALARGVAVGVAAIVTGGIDDQDLRDFLGYDLGVAVTGSEHVGLTLIITEGFGDIAMAERTYRLLTSRAGAQAAVNGATQIRAGVLRPEIVIPRSAEGIEAARDESTLDGQLRTGVPVRIIRDPWFGMIGSVAGLPSEPQLLASGSRARVLEVAMDDGRTLTVPRANVELIEG